MIYMFLFTWSSWPLACWYVGWKCRQWGRSAQGLQSGNKENKERPRFCCRWNWLHPHHLLDDISKASPCQTERRKTKRQKGGSSFHFVYCSSWTGGGAISNDSKIAWTSIIFLFHSCNRTIFTISWASVIYPVIARIMEASYCSSAVHEQDSWI